MAVTTKITLEDEFTWEGLQRLQLRLDSLKARVKAEGDNDVPALEAADNTKLDIDERDALKVQIAFVRNVFEKGGNGWRFLEASYRLSQHGGSWRLDDLAARLGETHAAVLAFNRNLGRTAKKWTKVLDVLQLRSPGNYALHPAVAAAVRMFLSEQKVQPKAAP